MKKKIGIKAWAWWLLALIGIVTFILANGLMDNTASHAFSDWFAGLFGLSLTAESETGEFFLRKFAHITEYALLGFVLQTVWRLINKKGRKLLVCCPLLCVLAVGILDEIFQSFGSRNSAVSDVLLDFFGGVMGMIMATVVYRIGKKHTKHIGGKRNE